MTLSILFSSQLDAVEALVVAEEEDALFFVLQIFQSVLKEKLAFLPLFDRVGELVDKSMEVVETWRRLHLKILTILLQLGKILFE